MLLLQIAFSIPSAIESEYIADSGRIEYDPGISKETEAIDFCKDKRYQAWFDLAKWLKQRQFLAPKARSQCFNMGRALQRAKVPSVALGIACKKAWEDAEIRGWNHSSE